MDQLNRNTNLEESRLDMANKKNPKTILKYVILPIIVILYRIILSREETRDRVEAHWEQVYTLPETESGLKTILSPEKLFSKLASNTKAKSFRARDSILTCRSS